MFFYMRNISYMLGKNIIDIKWSHKVTFSNIKFDVRFPGNSTVLETKSFSSGSLLHYWPPLKPFVATAPGSDPQGVTQNLHNISSSFHRLPVIALCPPSSMWSTDWEPLCYLTLVMCKRNEIIKRCETCFF